MDTCLELKLRVGKDMVFYNYNDCWEERNKCSHKETRLIPRNEGAASTVRALSDCCEPLLLRVKKNRLRCSGASTRAQHHREPHPLLLTTAHQ
uniref:Uncharacterized protein n=1 Tax=Knipowitschia caucasica TaxID=637954 RepID=A0AAV2KPK9_KNICA